MTALAQLASPYSRFAHEYDQAMGIGAFLRTRNTFEELVRRYGIGFGSAADLGCGTGLFACYLSACWNVPVFAVDRSLEMLRVAARRCRGLNVCLLHQDIRCLRLPQPVDIATANFDTLNHLLDGADLRLALRRIAENLRPGGHLVFDLVTTCQPLGGRQQYRRHLRSADCGVEQRIRWDHRQRMLSILVILHSRLSRPAVVERHRERAYSPVEVGRWLLGEGYVVRGVHDSRTLSTAADCPPRIAVVVRKGTP